MKTVRPKRWQLQEAKAKLSQVVDEMLDKGPQVITRHGQDVAALIPIKDLPKVLAPGGEDPNQKGAILKMLQRCPYPLADLDLKRNRSPVASTSIFED